jgi:hypothetical protein
LSTREGQIPGRSFAAQSSSLNKSDVAASAMRAALRACTKGSRKDLAKAAVRTLVRVYQINISYHPFLIYRKEAHIAAKIARNLA